MELRLLLAALLRKRGMLGLAVLAIAIGGSVAGALLHVSHGVSQKLTRELRALGPNLLLLPADGAMRETPGGTTFLAEDLARTRLRDAGLRGTPLLFVTAQAGERTIPVVGADLQGARRLHPSWRVEGPAHGALMGVRLARRLGISAGETLRVLYPPTGRSLALPISGLFESGSPDDEAWWVPLGAAQRLAGLEGRISLAQARVEDPDHVPGVVGALERGGGTRAMVLRALAATEADLLDRTRRLMAYVTLLVLLAAGLCAYGTLTDLALERRREIALLKALGASPVEVVRLFGAESAAVGLVGGLLGWILGVFAAHLIGRQVFHAAVGVQWDVLLPVLGVSIGVALLAGLGPIRLALAVEPAAALKDE